MKINRMWAMFDDNGEIYSYTLRLTRREVIDKVEQNTGMKWRYLYKQCGRRIKKVVVLPVDKAGQFLPGREQ